MSTVQRLVEYSIIEMSLSVKSLQPAIFISGYADSARQPSLYPDVFVQQGGHLGNVFVQADILLSGVSPVEIHFYGNMSSTRRRILMTLVASVTTRRWRTFSLNLLSASCLMTSTSGFKSVFNAGLMSPCSMLWQTSPNALSCCVVRMFRTAFACRVDA
jgi:hypothetical protein